VPNSFKEWAETIQHVATLAAIIVGGLWAVLHFRLRRQKWPRANIAHSALDHSLPQGTRLLRVTLTVSNAGEVLLRLKDGLIRIHQMRPWPIGLLESEADLSEKHCPDEEEYRWPSLVERHFSQQGFELEPNETEKFFFDFFLKPDIRSVIIYSYVRNISKKRRWWHRLSRRKEIGWMETTVHELQSTEGDNGTGD
jgi:hypothetical protein